uniref:Uncharacterized protein n=1 Tax=Sinocyclocheilus grahami TaxID=75366 RepID=A0A672Q4Z9_SINGR
IEVPNVLLNLILSVHSADEAFIQKSNETTTVGIYVLKFHDESQDIGIVLKGQNVLQGLDNFALATAMLFDLMYALNLNYPPEMKYTLEVLQKEVMDSFNISQRKLIFVAHTQ